ncbi:MAG: acyl carrier protein [Gammaproteobacteria bacterium]
MITTMSVVSEVKTLLANSLQLPASRSDGLNEASPLLGAIPELDSFAVVTVVTGIEEHFGFSIDDDEISADTFATLGSLIALVEAKLHR